ncbi:hypothetical protein KRX54_04955 [Actinomycetaceae bacterium TAE3-ERU4]|nr:hypothetical protein [Actinomycetaceae bacterium TAE3-ERU4]
MGNKSGWTVEKGIYQQIYTYLVSYYPRKVEKIEDIPSFCQFRSLPAKYAKKLLEIIPAEFLEDRQNFAPKLVSFLEAGKNHERELEFFGYYIGPKRKDERLTIDSFVYYPTNEDEEILRNYDAVDSAKVWEAIAKKLDVLDAIEPPDELLPISPTYFGERSGWWVWWD